MGQHHRKRPKRMTRRTTTTTRWMRMGTGSCGVVSVCGWLYVVILDSYPPLLFPSNLIRFNYIPFVNTYIWRGRHSTIYIIDTVPWARIEYHNFMPKKRWNLTYSRLEKHYQQVELHPFVTLIINLRTGENEQQWPKTTVGWNAPK